MVSHMTVIPLQNCCSITYHSLYAVCCIPWLTYQLTGDSCLFTPLTCLPSPPSPPRPSRLATTHLPSRASQVAAVAKDPPARAGDVRDASLILGLGRSPGGGHGNPLRDSCLENPVDRGAWWGTVHGVAESWTCLKWLSLHTFALCIFESVGV